MCACVSVALSRLCAYRDLIAELPPSRGGAPLPNVLVGRLPRERQPFACSHIRRLFSCIWQACRTNANFGLYHKEKAGGTRRSVGPAGSVAQSLSEVVFSGARDTPFVPVSMHRSSCLASESWRTIETDFILADDTGNCFYCFSFTLKCWRTCCPVWSRFARCSVSMRATGT